MEEIKKDILNTAFQRNSSFELLRIICIIFIIALHFAGHGGFDFDGLENTTVVLINRTWISFLQQFGKAGVNIFVLISAYFLVGKPFKTRKIIEILFEMLFFSILLGFGFLLIKKKDFSFDLFKTIFLPFGSGTWWFMTSYLLLYIFSPFLNLGIKLMTKKMHLAITIFLLLIWSFLPTFLTLDYGFSIFGWFLTLYFIASFIRQYDIKIRLKPFFGVLISISIICIWFMIKCCIKYFAGDGNAAVESILGWFDLLQNNNFIHVAASILLFLSFKEMNIKVNRFINIVASTTLAIYIVHDYSDMRMFLWTDLFHNASYSASEFLIPYSILVILGVFLIGVLIGLAYKYTFGLLFHKVVNILDQKVLFRADNILNLSLLNDACNDSKNV